VKIFKITLPAVAVLMLGLTVSPLTSYAAAPDAPAPQPMTVTIYPSGDTQISAASKLSNYGVSTTMGVRSAAGKDQRTIMRFGPEGAVDVDPAALDNVQLVGATLHLYVTRASGDLTVELRPFIAPEGLWEEVAVTWKRGAETWEYSGGPVGDTLVTTFRVATADAGSWLAVPLTAAQLEALSVPNEAQISLVLKADKEGCQIESRSVVFKSKETLTDCRPYITLEVLPGIEPTPEPTT
jgi:hypothetical protein